MQIIPLPAFRDNYIWLLRHGATATVVDPGDAAPVLRYLADEGLTLGAILVTHHHSDHVGGIDALLAAYPADDAHEVRLAEGAIALARSELPPNWRLAPDELDDPQAIVQIGAKQTILNALRQVAVGSADEARVAAQLFLAADPAERVALQHAQQLAPCADGVVIGSALVQCIASSTTVEESVARLTALTSQIKAALRPPERAS